MPLYPDFVPHTSNDSFQYFSVAENALGGYIGYTSLIHFDAERSFGVTPAPMVTFPMGYPLVITLLSLLGVSLQKAALLVNALSTAGSVLLLAWIGNRLGWSRIVRNAIVAVFAFNSTIIEYGSFAWTEPLFTAIVLAGTTLIVAARMDGGSSRWRWTVAGLTFGAAYFVRYAGLFFVLGLGFLVSFHFLASNRELAKRYAVTLVTATIFAVGGIARNIDLVGNWRGGNEKIVSNAVFPVLAKTYSALHELFIGPGFGLLRGPTAWMTGLRALLLLSLMAASIGWLICYRRAQHPGKNHNGVMTTSAGIDVCLLVGVYGACMFYAGLTSVISYGTRMFVPLLPLLVLLIGMVAHTALTTPEPPNTSGTVMRLALGASVCVYLVLNSLHFLENLRTHAQPDPSSIARIMTATNIDGMSPYSIVRNLTGPTGVIVANNGQAVGHIFQRRTVSLVGPRYSAVEWNENAVRQVAHQFNAAAVVIYVPTAAEQNDGESVPSVFVRQLTQGDAPSWMKLVYRSQELLIYSSRFDGVPENLRQYGVSPISGYFG